MTQSSYPPTDPGSPGNPDPISPSPLGDQSSWYTPWTPDPSSTPPIPPPPGGQPASAFPPPEPAAPWGVPGPGSAPQPGPFGAPPGTAGPPPGAYGTPPNAGAPPPPGHGPAPYGPGAYGPGPGYPGMGYQGMGYRGWRRGMYGAMGGRPVGAFVRRRAISNITTGAIFLVIGIVVTAASYGAVSSTGGVYFVPFGLIIIGALWLIRGVALLVRSSRLP